MGTSEHPESVPHWSNVAMFANKLENFRKRQKGFWLLFRECCWQCGGGGLVENILTDVTDVRREHPAGNYQPDITLERGDSQPVWLEFTDASPPSIPKLNQSQGGMCIYNTSVIGLGFSQKSFGL